MAEIILSATDRIQARTESDEPFARKFGMNSEQLAAFSEYFVLSEMITELRGKRDVSSVNLRRQIKARADEVLQSEVVGNFFDKGEIK
jgi:hypothetical protein